MSTTTYRAVKVQLHTPVEGQSYKSVSWHWRVETSPLGTYLTGEDGKPLEFDTKAAAEVAAFDADPLADIDPALYGLPQDSEIGPEVYGGGTATRELDRIRRALDGLEGKAYLWRAEKLLAEAGFVYTGTHCTCAHEGEYGHDFDCGYTYRPTEREARP